MTDQVLSSDDIRENVRQYYADRARQGPATEACCGDSQASSACCSDYQKSMLDQLPAEVADFSLGCADPITAAELKAGETVLDLGSGGGLDCFLAASAVGPAGRVIGVDMTDEMLQRARSQAERLGLTNVEFRKGLIESLPADDRSVDVVISNCVINLSPDKPTVLREIARVLRPGGRVAVADIVTRGEMLPSLRFQMDQWSACVTGAMTVDGYVGGLREAGFTGIVLRPSDPKLSLEQIQEGMPFSALITARKAG